MAKGLALAYHNLAVMLEAGLPFTRALGTVASGQRGGLKRAFSRLADGAREGTPLSETMRGMPRIFSPLEVTIVESAETSGSLPDTLEMLADWHDFSNRMRARVLSGMLMPALIFHLAALIIPVPDIVLRGLGLEGYLVFVLRILGAFYIVAGVIFIILRMTPQRGAARVVFDSIGLRIPILGRALHKLALSRYSWVYHMLSKAGVPATEVAEKSVAATSNAVVAGRLKGGVASARAGHPVSEGFSEELPADFLNIWRMGEESGTLEKVTKRLAERNAEDAEFWFKEITRWTPRLVYAIIAVFLILMVFRGYGMISDAFMSW
ncbi:MAG: type II secretion system F family protein [Phycisphaerales bacterium]|nr:MAG: type II secretion system F family protein [Phycisphaerales bacterium]